MEDSTRKRTREEVSEEEQLSSDEIIQTIQTMKAYQGTAKEKQRHFRKKIPEFADRYPSLFQMACEPNFDIQRLEFMLQMRDNVAKNRVSQHEASVKVGENLFKEYVKPLVAEMDKNKK